MEYKTKDDANKGINEGINVNINKGTNEGVNEDGNIDESVGKSIYKAAGENKRAGKSIEKKTSGSKLPLPIGMRNIKTGISVLICLLIYRFLPRDGSFLASTSAIICLQGTVSQSVFSGLNRIYGTAIGAFLGMILLYINLYVPAVDLTIAFATVGVMLLILICNIIDKNDAIVIGTVVLLLIVLEQSDEAPYMYSLYRLLDTFIGIAVAVLVNMALPSPPIIEDCPCPSVPCPEQLADVEKGQREEG